MKKVIVFGATGTIGQQVVAECLREGHEVTAFVRSQKPELAKENVKVIAGDVFDEAQVSQAIAGQDVVVSALGNMNFENPTLVVAPFVKMAVRHLQPSQRFIIVCGSGLALHDATTLRRDLPGQPEFLNYPRQDHWEAYTAISPLDVDYLFICPTMIEAAAADGAYKAEELYFPKGVKRSVKSGNVGRLIAKEISENRFRKTRVAIADAE